MSGSKRKKHQFIRMLFLAILAGTAAISVLTTAGLGGNVSLRSLAMAGAFIFEATSVVEIVLICLVTPIFMAGAIQQESSPRTWDLLLTTPLSSIGIVVGNLAGRVFFVLALILAGLPILLSLQLFGGVNPASIMQSAVIAAGTACVVGAAAVMLSASRTGGRRAVLAFYTGIAVVLAITWVADASLREPLAGSIGATGTTWATALNPFLVLESLLRPASYVAIAPLESTSFTQFWLGNPVAAFAATCGLTSVALVGWATLRVRTLGPLIGQGTADRKSLSRGPRPIGLNPISWRASSGRPRRRVKDVIRWGWAGAAFITAVVIVSLLGGGLISPTTARSALLMALIIETCTLILAAIAVSATSITRDREDGSLDLLLTTPIQATPYLNGKLLGVGRLLIPLLLAPLLTAIVVAATLAFHPADPDVTPQAGVTQHTYASWGGLLGFAMTLPVFVGFCIAIGLHWSVRSRRSGQAMLASVLIAGLAAGLLVPCVIPAPAAVPWYAVPIVSMSPVASILLATGGSGSIVASSFSSDGEQWWLIASGGMASIAWLTVVMMSLKTTARGFVRTMRQLAGTS